MWRYAARMIRSRRVGFFLCLLGFVWGVTMINISLVSSPQHSSQQLQDEIVELSEKYVRQLARETQDTIDGPYAGRLTGYDLKKTMAVLLENILVRLDRLERRVELQNLSRPLQIESPSPPGSRAVVARSVEPVTPGPRIVKLEREPAPVKKVNAQDLISGAQENCTLSSQEMADFPHCTGKIEWMKAHWESDKCYGIYGVDGSYCSHRVYLSEVEIWCPLLPGRKRLFLNITSSAERRANINYDIAPLLEKLKDPKNREQNYAWIRERITRNWAGWVDSMKQLRNTQNLEERKQKKVLVHLGLLSKKSGFKIAENSFKGGPLGELVQWSDVISALYILGHDITITSEVEQLASKKKKVPTATLR